MSKYAKTMSQLHAVENYLTNLANTAFKWVGILGFQSIILRIGGQVLENKRGVEVALPLLSWASTKYAFRGGELCHTLRPQNCSQITCVFKVCVHEAPGLGAFASGEALVNKSDTASPFQELTVLQVKRY